MYIPSVLLRADNETRTRDPRITNALLYQLSHIGIKQKTSVCKTGSWLPWLFCECNVSHDAKKRVSVKQARDCLGYFASAKVQRKSQLYKKSIKKLRKNYFAHLDFLKNINTKPVTITFFGYLKKK